MRSTTSWRSSCTISRKTFSSALGATGHGYEFHAAFEYALNKQAIAYRDCSPAGFRLQQIADFICEVELAAIKYEANEAGGTERLFFGTNRDFKKNYLKKLRKKRLR